MVEEGQIQFANVEEGENCQKQTNSEHLGKHLISAVFGLPMLYFSATINFWVNFIDSHNGFILLNTPYNTLKMIEQIAPTWLRSVRDGLCALWVTKCFFAYFLSLSCRCTKYEHTHQRYVILQNFIVRALPLRIYTNLKIRQVSRTI